MPATSTDTPERSTAPRAVAEPGPAREFALGGPLTREQLLAAPVRWPRPSRLAEPLQAPTAKIAAGLQALGLATVGELLEHLPSDSRRARTVAALAPGEQATVAVEVRSIAVRPVRRRGMRPLVEARVLDTTGSMRATFFNQPWLAERYTPGTRLLLHGKADERGGFRVSHHAVGSGIASEAGEGDAVAHYPAAEGVTSTQLLTLVQSARTALADVIEPLPCSTRTAERLPDRAAALAAMHFPREPGEVERGRRRLAFEELLLAQLVFLRRRARRRALSGAPELSDEPTLTARWRSEALPFVPTGDQLRAIEAIDRDLAQRRPMQRLLMGEVGSGKTVVALHAMLRAVEHGRQAALMAPTKTLAEQHFATIQGLLGAEPVSAALLTGSTPAARRRDTLGKLASGELSLIVGTHALIEPDVRFAALAVAVIDEQHRFGVRQRAALAEGEGAREGEGESDGVRAPHVLHMTATPIPRTLALARYGDLDTTALHELPQGRKPIDTRMAAGEAARTRAYAELRAELDAGRQAFVVCPLVEEADPADVPEPPQIGARAGARAAAAPELRAATAELARLREGELRGYRLALLHGAMPARAKQEAMASFASGEAQVLVATTVIEVGIDVPNATVMLVENAERFGLSQLHQLRGRVGRGEHGSICFLAGPAAAASSPRLSAMVAHGDGFRLAEIDLQLRKEGELIGTRQSGLGSFRVAMLPQDSELLERARASAEAIAAADPELRLPEHALLGDALGVALGPEQPLPIPG
jgi:ATP-dependent DNA helicase RecG